jgi:hypothetical protein
VHFPQPHTDGVQHRARTETSDTSPWSLQPHLPMMWASPVSTVSCELIASKLEFSNSFMSLGRGSVLQRN